MAFVLYAAFLAIFLQPALSDAVLDWHELTGGNWSTANFWEYDSLPCAGDQVRLPQSNTSYRVEVHKQAVASRVSIAAGATLVIKRGAKLTLSKASTLQCARFTSEVSAIALSPSIAEVNWQATGNIASQTIQVTGGEDIELNASARSVWVPLQANVSSHDIVVIVRDVNGTALEQSTQVNLTTSIWESSSGFFNATCNWLDSIAACNSHVIAPDNTPDDEYTVLTVANSQTVRSITLKEGVKMVIKPGARLRISHSDGQCVGDDCSASTAIPTETPVDRSTTSIGGNGGTTAARDGGTRSPADTTVPTGEGSSSSNPSPIIPIVVAVFVIMVIVVVIVVYKRRQQNKATQDSNAMMFHNGAFVGNNGRQGFEAFEVDVRNTLTKGNKGNAAWDEAQYDVTDKNNPNYASMGKGSVYETPPDKNAATVPPQTEWSTADYETGGVAQPAPSYEDPNQVGASTGNPFKGQSDYDTVNPAFPTASHVYQYQDEVAATPEASHVYQYQGEAAQAADATAGNTYATPRDTFA
eukprot:m.92724 g.92724  ORF g.92724 m.92724 type:complete len:527 (-) comp14959_c0_seq1:86-1666(-)